jgi:hypothetical protein
MLIRKFFVILTRNIPKITLKHAENKELLPYLRLRFGIHFYQFPTECARNRNIKIEGDETEVSRPGRNERQNYRNRRRE